MCLQFFRDFRFIYFLKKGGEILMKHIYFEWENGLSARSIFPRAVKHLWKKYGTPVKCELRLSKYKGGTFSIGS